MDAIEGRAARRLDEILRHTVDLDDESDVEPEVLERVAAWLREDPIAAAVGQAAVLDEEAEKAWFYGALLRTFLNGQIPTEVRPRMLRLTKRSYSEELKYFAASAYWYGRFEMARQDLSRLRSWIGDAEISAPDDDVRQELLVGSKTIVGRMHSSYPSLTSALKDDRFAGPGALFDAIFLETWVPVANFACRRIGLDTVDALKYDPHYHLVHRLTHQD